VRLGKSSVPLYFRIIRASLRRLNIYLTRRYEAAAIRSLAATPALGEFAAAEQLLRGLDLPDDNSRAYFEKHLPRLARTLALVPRAASSSRILELGCYKQITPFLHTWHGYREVRGAYKGPAGWTDHGTASVRGQPFAVDIDHFDAERDRFPYEDAHFETVLACELIEHLLYDPMHLLLEAHRVLEEGGRLLITTPNAGSLISVARALKGYENPQVYALYTRPDPRSEPEIPHVREYTTFELQTALESAGFEIETLFTEPIAEFARNLPLWDVLAAQGYDTSMRGEQTYCVAVKRANLPVTRYPYFLYSE